jgi:asparagine synthase (glutamine-hydrolysing)
MDWVVFKGTQESGVRILLSGNDGDTVVGYGYYYLMDLARAGKLRKLVVEAKALAAKLGRPYRKVLWDFGIKPNIPLWAMQAFFPDKASTWNRLTMINPEFAGRNQIAQKTLQFGHEKPHRRDRDTQLISIASASTPWTLISLGKLAAPFGLEPRYPFFDARLVEFCVALPASQKLSLGWNRIVMRRAMEGILPPEVQWRAGKNNLSGNFNRRFFEDSGSLIKEVIFGDPDGLDAYVDYTALSAAYERYAANPARINKDAFSIFWALCFMLWLRNSEISK